MACVDIVNGIYKRRTGENATATSVLTTGGVIVTPREISTFAAEIIKAYTRVV
jgi:adenylosuccinate synthase